MSTITKIKKATDKYHWYCLSFVCREEKGTTYVDSYRPSSVKKITLADIDDAAKGAGLGEGRTLQSVSYLGYMTEKEFKGTHSAPPYFNLSAEEVAAVTDELRAMALKETSSIHPLTEGGMRSPVKRQKQTNQKPIKPPPCPKKETNGH